MKKTFRFAIALAMCALFVSVCYANQFEANYKVEIVRQEIEKLFNIADRLIPAPESPQQAAFTGIKRKFGRTDFARLVGMSDENSINYRVAENVFLVFLRQYKDWPEIKHSLPAEDDSLYLRDEKRKFLMKNLHLAIK